MSAYDILTLRGVTRLCHFTKFQSLTHIIPSVDGILASSAIQQDTKNVNDTARYDGELDFVCCSVQYPNSWFLKKTMERDVNKIFQEWVVLYIDLNIIRHKNAKFCPCNASKAGGAYLCDNMSDIDSIFASKVSTFAYPRTPKMLSCCPTDGQAEILIENNIPREYIKGIAVGNEEIAGRIYAMLKMYDLNHISIYLAPDVLTKRWSSMVREGELPEEIPYYGLEED